jgi:membrane-bound inhibitor of C-type lysozyme
MAAADVCENALMRSIVSLVPCVAALIVGCASTDESTLTARGGKPVTYRCAHGEKVAARYYALSDESLRFVKLVMPDNRSYTLPLALSASGTCYTDERELVWWSKGDGASVQRRDADGKWRPVLECPVQRD